MKARALVLGIVVTVVLLGVVLVLYLRIGGDAERHYRNAIALTRQIQQLSSQWSVEVARVKSDPLADFDSLAAFIPRLASLKQGLTDTARRIPELPDRLGHDVNAYLSTADAMQERVERFKTGYAVVRNSTRYLPLAAANLTRQAQGTNAQELMRSIAVLSHDMNLFLSNPTNNARARLSTKLEQLREASLSQPPGLANGIANFLAHAEVLLERQAPTEELFQKTTSGAVSDLAERLMGDFEFELQRAASVSSWHERGMIAALGTLSLFWVLLAMQQRLAAAAPSRDRPQPSIADLPGRPAVRAEPPIGIGDPGSASVSTAATREPGLDPLPRRAPRRTSPPSMPKEGLATGPLPTVPGDTSAELAIQHEFLSRCVAQSLAASADRTATRMHSLRQIQHRIQNLIQHDDFLLPDLEEGANLEEEVDAAGAITTSVQREMNALADLARRLGTSAGSPNGVFDRDMINLNHCVEDALRTTRAEESATVVTRLGRVPEILASAPEIRLMLTEIIENAVHAVEDLDGRAGTIKVDTARRDDQILITVTDNGDGISEDRRANISKPFYTSQNGAMGLGLTLAHHLAERYRGDIQISSLPHQGTITRIVLPANVPGV